MHGDYVLLTEQGEMWAKMLMEVLEDNGISCASLPVYGFALSLKTGAQERLKVFVPADQLSLAQELAEQLFSGDCILEEE